MKGTIGRYLIKISGMLAASAFAELGDRVSAMETVAKYAHQGKPIGAWEKEQTAIAFTESQKFDKAKKILNEHEEYPLHPDDCQYGDNDLCYSQAR